MVTHAVPVGRQSHLRSVYIILGLVMCVYVVAGFAESYFFKTVFDSPPLRPMVHLHGLLFSAWMVLFVVQASLIGTKRYLAHRRLGVFGLVLAGAMVLVGTYVGIRCSGDAGCGAADPLFNNTLTIGDMVMLAAFVTAGAVMRSRREWHKRLMLLATVSIIDASVFRWSAVAPLFATDNRSVVALGVLWLITDLPLVAAATADYLKNGSVHAAYVWGGSALVASQAVKLLILQVW